MKPEYPTRIPSSTLNHAWRWLATALSFLTFGIGGLCMRYLVFPLINLLERDDNERKQRAQRFIHNTFRFYIAFMKGMGVLDYQIEDRHKLQGARLLLANHPSLLDVVFLIAMIPNANCVVKGRLLRNPVMWGPLKAAGYIINDGTEDVIEQANQAFARGETLIVFPEGTRTTPHQPLTLKRGAAQIAVRTAVDITPMLIQCHPTTLTKQDRWYQVPQHKIHFWFKILDQIAISPYVEQESPSLAARALTRDLTDFFTKELSLHEHPQH